MFGVFDGHGDGGHASDYVAKNLRGKLTSRPEWTSAYRVRDPDLLPSSILSACYDLDEGLRGDASRPTRDGGTTAIIALVYDRHLVVANVGDSRCILVRKKKRREEEEEEEGDTEMEKPTSCGCPTAMIRGTTENEPPRPRRRSSTASGSRTSLLGVSRAFGDYDYKSNAELPPSGQAMVCTPKIFVREASTTTTCT